MMSFFLIWTLSVGGVFAQSEAKTSPPWSAQMQGLSSALVDILPLLYAPDPKTPGEIESLQKKSSALYEASKKIDLSVKHGTQPPDFDPTLVFVSEMFREEVENAHEGIQRGFYGYSKSRLKSSVGYCIACHTRDGTGPQFALIEAIQQPLKNASWIERIKFQVALRRFDVAYADVMKKIEDPVILRTDKIGIEPAVKIALSIAVRVKNSPEQALLIAKKLLQSQSPDPGLKDKAMVWESDARAWKKEFSIKPQTEAELIKKAKSLIGLEGPKPYEISHHGEVRYLRATELMHTLLKKYPNSDFTAEALYIIGRSYEVINELSFGGLNEKYYEKCIRLKPHTPLAKTCFMAYKESVEFGYSGSRGLRLPERIQDKMRRLQSEADPGPAK